MDSFEASTQFAQILRNLTPSTQNLTEASYFALKNSESEDYLFPVILDIVNDEGVELNTKSTIFHFIEVLMYESFQVSQQPKTHYSYPYVHNIKNVLPKILLQVLPGTNNSSLYNTYNCIKGISKTCKFSYDEYDAQFKAIDELFTEEDRKNIDADISFPKIEITDGMASKDPLVITWELLIMKKKQSQYERLRLLKHLRVVEEPVDENEMFAFKTNKDQSNDSKSNPNELLSRSQILARMEDDREAHKKSKETIWVVNRPKEINYITEEEFLVSYWNKLDKMNEIEDGMYRENVNELNKLVMNSYKDKQM